MIELALPCELLSARQEPFVVKAETHPPTLIPELTSAHYAPVVPNIDQCVLASEYGPIVVHGLSAKTARGDVFYVDPEGGRAYRWLRRTANQNTLLVTERCDQLCIMCSQPPRKTHVDLFTYFRDACFLAEPHSVIGFSGGEPTLFKDQLLPLLLETVAVRPDLSFHVLTNAQHFQRSDIARLRALAPFVWWGVPAYSASPTLHDHIVGKDGAFAALEHGLACLIEAGAIIELRTVVMRQTAAGLGDLAEWVVSRIPGLDVWAVMQLERQGFARNRWADQFFDHSNAFGPIADAVAYATAWGAPVALYNFPHCTVPAEFRHLAPPTISDWKQSYFPECDQCGEKQLCGGLFAWHSEVPYQRWGTL